MGKNLWTDAGKGEKIRANRSDNDFDEARFVCSTIQEYIDKGVSPKDLRFFIALTLSHVCLKLN